MNRLPVSIRKPSVISRPSSADSGIRDWRIDHGSPRGRDLRITDRSYLIAEGKVICEGTPLEVVNNPIAKEKYLGETFNAAGIGERLDVTPTASTVRSLLLNEKLFEMVEELGGPNYAAAVNALRERGSASVLPLIAGLERNDRNIRILSHRILCELVQHELPFNPDADEVNRLMQVAKIRSMLQQRKVG